MSHQSHHSTCKRLFILIATAVVVLLFPVATAQILQSAPHTKDLKLKFFSDVIMLCDHPDLNFTENPNVKAISWLFPDGSLVRTNDDITDSRHLALSPPSDNITVAVADRSVFDAFNLSATMIDDTMFGYYTCIVVISNANTNADDISAIRWGLNVHGADFSDLEERYKENAIVGGIAAAIMLVLVGGGCLLWHFNYSKRHNDNNDDLKKSGLEDLDQKLDDDAGITETSLNGKLGQSNDGFTAEEKGLNTTKVDIGLGQGSDGAKVEDSSSDVKGMSRL